MASIARADNCKECPTLNSLLWSRWNLTQGWLLRGVPSRLLCHAQNRSKWVKMGQESCRVANDLKISPPLPLHLPSKLHNKIKPPYVRLSSSWHKARFKHVCLHFQNNLNSSQVSQQAERKNKLQYLLLRFVARVLALDMICGQRWKHRTIWTLGDKKTKCNPLWMVVDYLDLVSETAPTFKAITRSSSAPSVVLWHSCQFVSTQPDFQNTNLIISKWNINGN